MSWKTKIALWLLKIDRQAIVIVPAMSNELIQSAKELVAQMRPIPTSGEHKRAQVLRGLLNRHPEESEGNCSRAIELVLCGAVS